MAKRTERQKAVASADKAFSEYIRARDRYVCKTCGMSGSKGDGVMTCGHLITRAKYATRWDELNAECQCRGCNMRHEYQPEIMTDLWVERHGYIAYHELVRKSNRPHKYTTGEIKELADEYKERTRKLP